MYVIFSRLVLITFCISAPLMLHADDGHHKKHHTTHTEQYIQSSKNFSYRGEEGLNYTEEYKLVINLSEMDSMPRHRPNDKEVGVYMTPEQNELVWQKLKDELPVSTNFKIKKAEFKYNNTADIFIALEESHVDIEFQVSEFLINASPYWRASFGIHDNTPALKEYVEPSKWTKETGYQSIRNIISSKSRPVASGTLIFEGIYTDDGEIDDDAYNEIFERIEIPISFDRMVDLPDGTKGTEKLINDERLEAIYLEPSIINLIPDLDF